MAHVRQTAMMWMVQHAPAAVAILDNRMCYLAASPRYVTENCASTNGLIGRCHYDVFPNITEHRRAIYARCFAAAIEHVELDRFVHDDGSADDVRWQITPWHDEDGAVGGLVVSTELLTPMRRAEERLSKQDAELARRAEQLEQRNAELELRTQELAQRTAQLETILETVPAAIYITHDGGARIDANRLGRDLLKARPGQNVSHSAPTSVRPPYRVVRDGMDVASDEMPVQVAAARGEDVRDWDCTVMFDDGSSLELQGYASPMPGPTGGAVAAFVDVTARRRAEEAVRERDAWLRVMFEQGDQVMYLLHAVRDEHGAVSDFTVLDVSPAALRVKSLTREEAIGRRMSTLIPAVDFPSRLEQFRRVLESGRS